MNSYLIVKTGKSGTKLNDLYDTEVMTESGIIKLCSNRLIGDWYQGVISFCKSRGVRGTLSVIEHTPKNADLLIAESQRSYLQLLNNVDWQVVARMDITTEVLGNLTQEASNNAWEALLKRDFICALKRDKNGQLKTFRFNIKPGPGELPRQYTKRLKEHKKFCRDFVKEQIAKVLTDYITIL